MAKFKLNKLVRDNMIDLQIAAGQKPAHRQLGPEEHKQALVEKIIEEAKEILTAQPQDMASEVADVQQALDDLKEKCGLNDKTVSEAQTKKNQKSGTFKQGLFVETLEVSEGDEWIHYYRAYPDRFPEIK